MEPRSLKREATLGNVGVSRESSRATRVVTGILPASFWDWNYTGLNVAAKPGFFGDKGTSKLLSYTPKRMWTFWGVVFDQELTAFYGNMTSHVLWSLVYPLSLMFLLLIVDFAANDGPIVNGKPGPARRWAIMIESLSDSRSRDFRYSEAATPPAPSTNTCAPPRPSM